MFYSHEILTNSQYGVATVWLVATLGKGGQRKLNRKNIQDVNVPKACEKIIHPGAPLALRLQSNLLYGVSRVFSHQCAYVLSDAECVQSEMLSYFRTTNPNEIIDSRAGKAKRQHITLLDDPNFDPMSAVPRLDLLNLNWDSEILSYSSQSSTQMVSQFTPLRSQKSSSSNISINLPESSCSGASHRLIPGMGRTDSPSWAGQPGGGGGFNHFSDDADSFGGLGLEIDGDGNLIGMLDDQADLPALPDPDNHDARTLQEQLREAGESVQKIRQNTGGPNMLIMGEQPLPDAHAFPVRTGTTPPSSPSASDGTSIRNDRVAEMHKVQKRRKNNSSIIMEDNELMISRAELRSWNENYVANMDAKRATRKPTTLSEARKNAAAFIYGNGIANVGCPNSSGIKHPLAEGFTGNALWSRIHGLDVEEKGSQDEGEHPSRRKRRRGHEDAASEDVDPNARNVKLRSDSRQPHRHKSDDGHSIPSLDDAEPEVGRAQAAPIDDNYSSGMMPWSRTPSIHQGSSVPSSVKKPGPSPLLHRSINPPSSIERYSDAGSVSDIYFPAETQDSIAGHDIASHEFLGYLLQKMEMTMDATEFDSHRWVSFHKLADPNTHTRDVAAQAFLHVLSLATRNAISVRQDGVQAMRPFGDIYVGVHTAGLDSIEW